MSTFKAIRFHPPDALRGLIIVLMALDHANYFIAQKHSSGEYWGGPFPVHNSALPFLTRLVTHLSAPGFFFLMGVGMLLFTKARSQDGWRNWKITHHFWIRGGILILLQLLVINNIWKAGPFSFPKIYIGVLIALGGTMILGSLFTQLTSTALLILTMGLLIGIELLHPDPNLWNALSRDPLNLTFMRSGGTEAFWSNYPILPWLELVIFGMAFGHWLRKDQIKAYKKGLWLGIALLLLFVILRSMNGFGNIRPRPGNGWIDFLNVVKYPPSMTFIFLTMGINLIMLWGFSRTGKIIETASGLLVTYGSVPLFAYVVHLLLYMLIGRLVSPHGISISAMYPYWILGLVILYPLCIWYGKFKQKRPPSSFWRFL